jgi:CHAD domain-containing protein
LQAHFVSRRDIHEKGYEQTVKKKSAHSTGIGERAGIVLFSQWIQFCDLREVVLAKSDVDSIHDLRVASRRMRATVSLFEPFIGGKTVKYTSKEFRRVTRELGRLRNIDEAVIYFGTAAETLPALTDMLPVAREEEMRVVTDVLKSFPREGMDRMLRKAVADLSGVVDDEKTLPVYLSETSIQRYQAVYDLLVPATILENVDTRHALRIAIKKWRYLLETLGQVCQQDYSAALSKLKDYQTLLGRLNDMVEFGVLCSLLSLPQPEAEEVRQLLERDSTACLEIFIKTAASRPLQYTFTL